MTYSLTIPAIVESIAALSEEERSQLFIQLYEHHLITQITNEILRENPSIQSSNLKNEEEKEELDLDIAKDPLVGLFSSDPHTLKIF
ncbi:hypothetical protein [Spirulina sp. 06S082]|uniref:hypothetical protein n=1 Tax=Spirulina sp. 06S082 TaxID=3110248 RepID=UPI002B2044EF|nr:hypothetical protein [Spirulina sp. 06S082]MEA5468952.1 hypothetical protein [Spirulina sp. 06S082]